MAHSAEVRAAVRAAFIGGLPLDQAAALHDVAPETARRWKRAATEAGDDWDRFQRASLIVSGGGFEAAMGRVAAAVILRAEAVMDRLQADTEAEPLLQAKMLTMLGDTLGKAQAAARRLMPESDRLSIETEAIKGFVNLLVRSSPSAAEAALRAMEAYSRGER